MANETIFAIREDVRKLAMVTNPNQRNDGPHNRRSGRITGDRQ
jgi:hypothetical protein